MMLVILAICHYLRGPACCHLCPICFSPIPSRMTRFISLPLHSSSRLSHNHHFVHRHTSFVSFLILITQLIALHLVLFWRLQTGCHLHETSCCTILHLFAYGG